jgi:hypothetical protein
MELYNAAVELLGRAKESLNLPFSWIGGIY